jgi:uncharacterized protein
MMWTELLTALALVLIIEGIIPFVNPEGVRRMFLMAAQMPGSALRSAGFTSMLLGLLLLYLVR